MADLVADEGTEGADDDHEPWQQVRRQLEAEALPRPRRQHRHHVPRRVRQDGADHLRAHRGRAGHAPEESEVEKRVVLDARSCPLTSDGP